MPLLGGYEAWIEVDGVRLEEYRAESSNEDLVVKCWIASEERKNYTIHCTDHAGRRSSKCNIYLDGSNRRGMLTTARHRSNVSNGVRISPKEIQLYQFGKVMLTDDDDAALQDESAVKELGTIKLLIEEGTIGRSIEYAMHPQVAGGDRAIHERSKKAAGHRTVLGPITAAESKGFVSFQTYSFRPVVIIFQHAPRGVLQARDIIPRDVTAVDEPDSRVGDGQEPATATDAEDEEDGDAAKARVARIAQLEEELSLLRNREKGKRKRRTDGSENGEGSGKRIKLEEIHPNRPFVRGEVIDLT